MSVYDVHGEDLSGGDDFIQYAHGIYDGLRIDVDERIWTSAGEAVLCHEPDGTLLGRILLPERVSNLTFGGPKRNRLFITATSSLYSVLLAVSGAKLVPGEKSGGN
jgi:gluconolactonase